MITCLGPHAARGSRLSMADLENIPVVFGCVIDNDYK